MIPPNRLLARAGSDRLWQSMRESFSSSNEATLDSLVSLGIVAAAFTVLLAVLILNRSRREGTSRFTRNPSKLLFHAALRQLGLGPADRLILRLAARKSRLDQPTLMLLSPALLDHYAGAWADGIAIEGMQQWVRQRIAAVSAQIFPGSPPPAPACEGPA